MPSISSLSLSPRDVDDVPYILKKRFDPRVNAALGASVNDARTNGEIVPSRAHTACG
jgi:hypothetical protein